MGDRIELVSVALSATDGQSQPDGSRGIDSIDNRFIAEFLSIGTAFFIDQCVAMKGRCYELFLGRTGQQVASELLDRELVKRHVAIDRLNDPVAIGPHLPLTID